MTRFVSTVNQTESEKPSIVMSVFVDLDFSSGHLRLHDGIGTIVDDFASPTVSYLGVGKFGGIDGAVMDSTDVIAKPIKLSLTGVDSAVISSAMTEDYQGRAVVIYLGFVNGGALVSSLQSVWEGRMDYLGIELSEGTGTISVNCEHRLRREPRIARYTDEDQQTAHSGDTFFHLLPHIQGFKSQWGDKPSQFTAGGSIPGIFRAWINKRN